MTKIYIIITLLALLFSLSCSDRIVFEESRFNPDDLIPVFSPPGGTYHNEHYVTITTKAEAATIRYTLDDSEPNNSSPVYSDSIYVSLPVTIKAKASKAGWETKSSQAEYSFQTATPSFDPPAGDYDSPQLVEILCETDQVTIRYTIDGSEPDTSSIIYSEPILVNKDTTLKAKAYRDGWLYSQIATASYQPAPVATPTFDPPGGRYFEPQRVTINCVTEGATIRYTTDGNEPTSSSAEYNEPIVFPLGTTLKAKAYKEGWTGSQTESAQYSQWEDPFEVVLVEGGTFNPAEDYTVTLSSFYMAKYEVTQSEYQSVMGTNPSSFSGNPNRPVERVSWFDAIEYCNRLSIREGLTPVYSYGTHGTNPDNWPSGWNTDRNNHTNVSCNWNANGYRLPTEMEWEFAARGGVPAQNAGTFNTTYSGSNNIDDVAWYSGNSGSRTHDVGTKAPNELGLYDMSGNVWNWVWDIWGNYPTGSYNNPTGPTSGYRRVLRGGSWTSTVMSAVLCNRNGSLASNRGHISLGFRVSRALN